MNPDDCESPHNKLVWWEKEHVHKMASACEAQVHALRKWVLTIATGAFGLLIVEDASPFYIAVAVTLALPLFLVQETYFQSLLDRLTVQSQRIDKVIKGDACATEYIPISTEFSNPKPTSICEELCYRCKQVHNKRLWFFYCWPLLVWLVWFLRRD